MLETLLPEQEIPIPEIFTELFEPARYKVYYGGRGGGKSWAFATALLIIGMQKQTRVLCARETQTSISDSVHRLLSDVVQMNEWEPFYKIQRDKIIGNNGTEFTYCGLRYNVTELKSKEGIDICWVEEAHNVSQDSWDILLPTIRKEGSEIWMTFNPQSVDDPTYDFVLHPRPNSIVKKVNWSDNPFFPKTLDAERLYLQRVDPDAYAHIWEGECQSISEAQVFKNKYVVEVFTTPQNVRFFHGADWGFATDPTVLVRCFVKDSKLYVDQEAYGVGIELDETPQLFNSIDTAQRWPIKADIARPETISYMKRQGFNISGAAKWGGSVQDGIAVLKSFEKIVVHPRCKHLIDELQAYSYKTDRVTGDVLPVLLDKNNHVIDSLRYSLDGYIKGHTGLNISAKLIKGDVLHEQQKIINRRFRF